MDGFFFHLPSHTYVDTHLAGKTHVLYVVFLYCLELINPVRAILWEHCQLAFMSRERLCTTTALLPCVSGETLVLIMANDRLSARRRQQQRYALLPYISMPCIPICIYRCRMYGCRTYRMPYYNNAVYTNAVYADAACRAMPYTPLSYIVPYVWSPSMFLRA